MGSVRGEAESVVAVAHAGRDRGARRAPADLDLMAPGAAPGDAPYAGVRPFGVVHGRDLVVAGVVPVRAPFVDVLPEPQEAERMERGVGVDRLRSLPPAALVVRERLGRIVPPGIEDVASGPRRVLPFGLGGEAHRGPRPLARPGAEGHGVLPGGAH